jgi:meso-butanediol dehydrogenase/(S,S)-butanediol dehydrogenase/diacetyl reductase
MTMRLEGKRILITGTGGGHGGAAQELFASEGARIVGCDLQQGTAERSAAALRHHGHDVHGFTVDLRNPSSTERWIEEAVSALGGIDVLYNNAAGYGFAPFAEMDLKLWRQVMSDELDILFHTTHPAWKYLLEGGGSVINTASLSALRGIAPGGQVAHAAAKGGVVSFTTAIAAEGAAHGIRANAISPGFVKTAATDTTVDDGLRAFVMNMHLIRRAGTPQDIAYLALYLASDESSWVTGQNISIDGGVTAGFRQ